MTTTSSPSIVRTNNKRPSPLVPLYINVVSSSGSIRIVDTLLFDANCWPIPLQAGEDDKLNQCVEANIKELAHSIISDAEVMGMGRTARHFTNRFDLWSTNLQQRVEDQLRPQLWALLETTPTTTPTKTTTLDSDSSSATTKQKVQNDMESTSNDKTKEETKDEKNDSTSSTMKKIHLRLSFYGIELQDDLDWDTSLDTCPIAFAKQVATDLKLPEEAAVVIATAILEQLYGVQVLQKEEGNDKDMTTTAATLLDPHERVGNLTHLSTVLGRTRVAS